MNFLQRLLSRKKRVLSKPGSETVLVKENSQPHALNAYMQRARIRHGEQVEANLKNVRITRTNERGEPATEGEFTMFFCPINSVDVIKRLSPGDNDELPGEVQLHNLVVPSNFKPGIYNLNNVLLYANGAINVTTTEKTTLEMVDY